MKQAVVSLLGVLTACGAYQEKGDAFQEAVREYQAATAGTSWNTLVGYIMRAGMTPSLKNPNEETHAFPTDEQNFSSGQLRLRYLNLDGDKICFVDYIFSDALGDELSMRGMDKDTSAGHYVEKIREEKMVVESFETFDAIPNRPVYVPAAGNVLDDVSVLDEGEGGTSWKDSDTQLKKSVSWRIVKVKACGKAPKIDEKTTYITVSYRLRKARAPLFIWKIVDRHPADHSDPPVKPEE